MPIDFTLAPEHEEIRARVHDFIQGTVIPAVRDFDDEEKLTTCAEYLTTIFDLREQAKAHLASSRMIGRTSCEQ